MRFATAESFVRAGLTGKNALDEAKAISQRSQDAVWTDILMHIRSTLAQEVRAAALSGEPVESLLAAHDRVSEQMAASVALNGDKKSLATTMALTLGQVRGGHVR